ncbi:hypothetical protein ADK55_18480 [Streptomyces sp. WM4235]|uniref:hypothetical protein n=1 Tax=Streptomyces sp. WM4235 TaxID=1415551 RepID=UPI0006AE7CDC|nr:hypothetical protein [Streptomyces sp. WM4235]KOU50536.1 hypothetical protein ADK55_18480 [Streptomyces sp. WM4235]
MTVRPPIVGAALWTAVMKAAENRCECRGACGKKHDPDRTRSQQRCDVRNGDHVSKIGVIVLIATPRDPINEGDFATAAQLPAKRLAAMCRPCHDAVLRKIRSAAKKLAPSDSLFDVEEYRVAKPTAGAA